MRTSLTFRCPVSIPDLIPNRDEGLSKKGIAFRMMTTHFNTRQPSDGRAVVWYCRPQNRHDELTAFICQRSGYKFPGSMKMIDEDGKMVGSPFYREPN